MPQHSRLTKAQRKWLESLRTRDPELFDALNAKLVAAVGDVAPEAAGAAPQRPSDLALETIVREGRPALTIRDNKIVEAGPEIEESARPIATRLKEAAAVINPFIPLIGRIDVANHPSNFPYVGTGWLVDTDVVVTNRHVAELIA